MIILLHTFTTNKIHVTMTTNKLLWVPSRGMRRGAGDVINSIVRRSPSPTSMSSTQHLVTLAPRKGSTLLPGTNPNLSSQEYRGYATYTHNKADKKQTKQAKYNNEKGKHKEIHRSTCKKPDCKDKFCKTHCDTVMKREAIGHATHGKAPANELDKVTVEVNDKKDFSNKSAPQKIVFYGTPHETPITPVVEPGNNIINIEEKIQKIIKKHEKHQK